MSYTDGLLRRGRWHERRTRQHATDLVRLFRRQSQTGGAPWPPAAAANPMGQSLAVLRLSGGPADGLFRGASLSATRLYWTGAAYEPSSEVATVSFHAFAKGYWFSGEDVIALGAAGQWHAIGHGHSYVAGVNTSPIAKGASAARTLPNGKVIAILARYDAIAAGVKFAAWWDDLALEWHSSGECP